METPFKSPLLRGALLFAAFFIGSAYLAIVHHVLIGKRGFREVPATVGLVAGSIEAVLGLVVLVYVWKMYRRFVARSQRPGTKI